MRRIAIGAVVLIGLLAGCTGGPSPAEEAFLAEMQERSSFVELPDPDGYLERGHGWCRLLAETKPEERYTFSGFMLQRGQDYGLMKAAQMHLGPEIEVEP